MQPNQGAVGQFMQKLGLYVDEPEKMTNMTVTNSSLIFADICLYRICIQLGRLLPAYAAFM